MREDHCGRYNETTMEENRESKVYGDVRVPDRDVLRRQVAGESRKSAGSAAGSRPPGPGRSPWNYITEEDLFRDFREDARRRQQKEDEGYENFRKVVREGGMPAEPYVTRVRYCRRWVQELLGPEREESASEGWKILLRFDETAPDGFSLSGYMNPTLDQIRRYYVMMSDLPRTYVGKAFQNEIRRDEYILALLMYDEADDDQVWNAILHFSHYKEGKSHFFETYSGEMKKAIRRVYGAVADAYLEKHKRKLTDDLFGEPDTHVWYPSPVISPRLPQELKKKVLTFQVDPVLTYTCRRGHWTETCYFPELYGSKILREQLKQMCRETERLLREAAGFRKLKPADMDEELRQTVKNAVGAYLREIAEAKREAARPKVHIDLGRLGSIRSDADYTRDQLLIGTEDEEPEGELVPEELPRVENTGAEPDRCRVPEELPSAESSAEDPLPDRCQVPGELVPEELPPAESPALSSDSPYGLTEDELKILNMLISGEGPADYIRSRRLFASIIADSINEKLFDEIGDSVIEETDTGLALVEDYADDLKDLLGWI